MKKMKSQKLKKVMLNEDQVAALRAMMKGVISEQKADRIIKGAQQALLVGGVFSDIIENGGKKPVRVKLNVKKLPTKKVTKSKK